MNYCVLTCFIGIILMIVTEGFPIFYDNDVSDKSDDLREFLEPAEIQNAMCNIVTDQITATANATITRQLKGVCHAKEVREQLKHLEANLMRELHKIHRVVQTIAAHHVGRKPVVFKYLPGRQ